MRTANESVPADDVKSRRARASRHLADGAVTEGYRGDRPKVIEMLNAALASEIVCVLRYKQHGFTAKGIHAGPVAAEFHAHAAEEQGHADRIAERIVVLRGTPNFSPEGLASRSHSQFDASESLVDMIREDLVAERIAIDSYRELIRTLGDDDPTTRRMVEEILATEEDHADEMANLLATLSPAEID